MLWCVRDRKDYGSVCDVAFGTLFRLRTSIGWFLSTVELKFVALIMRIS